MHLQFNTWLKLIETWLNIGWNMQIYMVTQETAGHQFWKRTYTTGWGRERESNMRHRHLQLILEARHHPFKTWLKSIKTWLKPDWNRADWNQLRLDWCWLKFCFNRFQSHSIRINQPVIFLTWHKLTWGDASWLGVTQVDLGRRKLTWGDTS